jgi:hypothetical protein
MMDSQEIGRKISWILKHNINCHLEYCKILLVNSLRFPDTISRRQRVLPEKKSVGIYAAIVCSEKCL